jgi:hypothetical protein
MKLHPFAYVFLVASCISMSLHAGEGDNGNQDQIIQHPNQPVVSSGPARQNGWEPAATRVVDGLIYLEITDHDLSGNYAESRRMDPNMRNNARRMPQQDAYRQHPLPNLADQKQQPAIIPRNNNARQPRIQEKIISRKDESQD